MGRERIGLACALVALLCLAPASVASAAKKSAKTAPAARATKAKAKPKAKGKARIARAAPAKPSRANAQPAAPGAVVVGAAPVEAPAAAVDAPVLPAATPAVIVAEPVAVAALEPAAPAVAAVPVVAVPALAAPVAAPAVEAPSAAATAVAPPPAAAPAVAAPAVAAPLVAAAEATAPAATPDAALAAETAADEAAEDDEGEEGDPEAEDHTDTEAPPGLRYSADVPESELERLWKETPQALGSLSIGFTDAGRLINGEQFPTGPYWTVVDPAHAYATAETVKYIVDAISAVARLDDESTETPRLRVNHLSSREGGWLRPHRSHQSGRDVDLAFYYLAGGADRGARAVRDNLDMRRNWALVRALITQTDVQMILLDRKLLKRFKEYALSVGEDPEWLDSLFGGPHPVLKHAPRHKDHFHVRFYSPRAQELGRRIQPLLPKGKPELSVAVHRIRNGDNLGKIARKYGTSVAAIRKANRLKGNAIRAGRTLTVPLARTCTDCPLPPEVVVPPRRMPPSTPELFERLEPPKNPPVATSA